MFIRHYYKFVAIFSAEQFVRHHDRVEGGKSEAEWNAKNIVV